MIHDVTVVMLVSETKAPEIVVFYHENIALFPSLNTTTDQMNDNTNCIITQSVALLNIASARYVPLFPTKCPEEMTLDDTKQIWTACAG